MTDTRNINQPDQSKQTDSEKKTPEQMQREQREQGQAGQFEKGQQGQTGQFEKGQQGQFEKGQQSEQNREKSAIGGGTTKSEELNKEKSPSSPTDR